MLFFWRAGHNMQCVSLLRNVPLATRYKRGNLRAYLALGISRGVLAYCEMLHWRGDASEEMHVG